MRNQNDRNEDEEWEVLSDDWTEAEAEEVEDAGGEESNDDDAIVIEKHDAVEPNDTEEIDYEVEKREEGIAFNDEDILSLDENHELLRDEEASVSHDDKEQDEEELTPGIRKLVEMGFSMKDSKEALFYSNGNMNQAISDLSGEDKDWHRMNRVKKDASIKLHKSAMIVGKAVDDGAAQLYKALQDKGVPAKAQVVKKDACIKLHETALIVGKAIDDGAAQLIKALQAQNVPAKAQVVAHKAKLTARSVGREIENFNHKYRFTDALATIGALFTAVLLAKGKTKSATATAAAAGTAFVAGEGMRSRRRGEFFE